MRPRKRILLYAFGAVERGSMAHVLTVRGYRVFPASCAEGALEALASGGPFDGAVVLHWHPKDGALAFMRKLHTLRSRLPVLFVGSPGGSLLAPWFTPVIFLEASTPNAEILESLRIVTQRKRGPKKLPGAAEGLVV